ncbi:hypothetical protein HPP92_029008 [Vanilla planifolia]|uniref:Uncharacterized protein n=1 Tax=Vanilla planifolia TaxID=51239 RepID=A0A835P592_VANPL|nr:hypothetical protein HPP92_029008 [Vanilla planifolia]KAG0446100.1 hypothetical protein HPP92_028996 [Vanilla planifolia]
MRQEAPGSDIVLGDTGLGVEEELTLKAPRCSSVQELLMRFLERESAGLSTFSMK